MTDWFEAGLPLDQVWYGDPHYWRNTLVDWARKQDPRAFQGKNMLRAYSVRHTQVSVVFDVAMLLVDLPRRTYMFVGFPVGIGGVPGVSVGFDGHMKIWDRDAFERAQSTVARIASEHGLSTPSFEAPDGSTWRAYVKMSPGEPDVILKNDGNTLTGEGTKELEDLVRGSVLASAELTPFAESRPGGVEIEVDPESLIRGSGSLQSSIGAAGVPQTGGPSGRENATGGCYVATAVYGSYDCSEVRVLRRWRDERLSLSSVGRGFVRFYYKVSPAAVRAFGSRRWFSSLLRRPLDSFVGRLRARGYSDLDYQDRA